MSERQPPEVTWFPSFLEALAVHDQVMLRYGGPSALRDEDGSLLQSALNRPRLAAHYEDADLVAQAASLLWGLVRNHPFEDGNKRTALVLTALFLERNGLELRATEDELVALGLSLAAGDLSIDWVDAWLREHAAPVQ